jgi:hypothetical protein
VVLSGLVADIDDIVRVQCRRDGTTVARGVCNVAIRHHWPPVSPYVKELAALSLLAAAGAFVLPRVFLPTPPVRRVSRPRLVETLPSVVGVTLADASPAAPRVVEAPTLREARDAAAMFVDAVVAPSRAPLPAALSRRGSTWVVDARQLPPLRQAMAGARLDPPEPSSASQGYRIAATDRVGLMRAAGIHTGDVLVGVNGLPLRNPDNALDALARLRGATRATFTFERGGVRYTVPVEVQGRSPWAL